MPTIEFNVALHPRQLQALTTEAQELLFGGASGGGKSHFLRHALSVWCLSIPGLQCVLIRKKNDDILSNHLNGPQGFRAILKDFIAAGVVRATQNGIKFFHGSNPDAVIDFQHCQDERQFDSAQGVERHVVAIDEATQISERLIRTFRAWCRMSKEFAATLPNVWKGKFPKILYTANPVGVSVGFFRRHFVKAREAFTVERVHGFLRQYIPSRIEDNLSADFDAHKGRMEGLNDKALARALDRGDWDAPLGDFFDCWDEDRHVIPDFIPPSHWYRYRSLDWGSADPFAVYWFAVSDGEMFDAECWVFVDGILVKRTAKLWFPRGAKIIYREWYGCQSDDPSKGLRMRNADIAKGILERSPDACEQGLVTLTDSYVFPDRGEEGGQTIAKTFFDNGVPLTLGDTSRVTGWAACKDALIGKIFDYESQQRIPLVYIQQQCKYLRDYIPALPRHPNEAKKHEDAAESGEATHSCDAWRLGVMALAPAKDKPVPDVAKIHAQIKEAQRPPTFEQAVDMIKKQKARSGGKHF